MSGARAKLRAVGEMLLEDQEAWPGMEAAHTLGAVAAALQQALAMEAVTTVMVLQEKQVQKEGVSVGQMEEHGFLVCDSWWVVV